MQGRSIVITAAGKRHTRELTAVPTLEVMQLAVGGSIESIPGWRTFKNEACAAFCNETGKIDGLPINPHAQVHWAENAPDYARHDFLRGDVLIIVGDAELMSEL